MEIVSLKQEICVRAEKKKISKARKKTRVNALIGMVIGIVVMTAAAVLANLYILFPAYGVPNGEKYILPFTIPFNLIKGAALTVITFLIYKPLSPILHGKMR